MDDMLSDRISDLPLDVLDIIFSHLSLQDAVRTSISSTKWTLHWKRIECLVLDKCFYYDVCPHGDDGEMNLSAYVRTVMNILVSHGAPLLKFHLYIPSFRDFSHLGSNHLFFDGAPLSKLGPYIPSFADTPAEDINHLILCVSRFGLQDLTLEFGDDDGHYTFPSYLFQCVELKHLSLKFEPGILSIGSMELPTHEFRKLSSLTSLHLCRGSVCGDVFTNIISNLPFLERLCLDYNNIRGDSFFDIYFDDFLGVDSHPLVINALELKHLSVTYDCLMKLDLKNTPNISSLFMRQNSVHKGDGYMDIVDFCGDFLKVESIDLNGKVLTQWKQNKVPERLPAPLEKHLSLTVSEINIYWLVQVRSLFCLIQSSPNLQSLNISIYQPRNKSVSTDNYLKSQLKEGEKLASLRTVRIDGVTLKLQKLQIVFVSIFLSRCPVLEKLYLRFDKQLNQDDKSKIIAFFNRFRRASTQAMIIVSK